MQRPPMHPGLVCSAAMLMIVAAGTPAAAERGPQTVVRQFCQADGNGQRITLPGWAALAPLLTWPYEPAWDTITLITGYNVSPPQPAKDAGLTVDVQYSVMGQLTPLGFNAEQQLELVTYHVQPDEQGNWHILGPLPPPHLFANQVDMDAMRRWLAEGDAAFLANSVFVWRMFQSAGWNVPYELTTDLLSGAAYRSVDDIKPGDLVVYLREGIPYHVGLLEARNQVVSSTLNAGITRSTVDAFPGEVRFLRLGHVEAAPTIDTDPQPIPTPPPYPLVVAPAKQPTPKAAVPAKKSVHGGTSARTQKSKPAKHQPVHRKPKTKSKHAKPTPTPSKHAH